MATDERELGIPIVIEGDRLPALHIVTARARVRSSSLKLPSVWIVMTDGATRGRSGHLDRCRLSSHPPSHRLSRLALTRMAVRAADISVAAFEQEARPRVIEGHVKPSRQRVTRNAADLSKPALDLSLMWVGMTVDAGGLPEAELTCPRENGSSWNLPMEA